MVVDRLFERFDDNVVEEYVDVGFRYVVVVGLGLGVVVVADICVDVRTCIDVDVEKIVLFAVLTTGGIVVV